MRAAVIAFVLGVALLQQQASLLSFRWSVAGTFFSLAWVVYSTYVAKFDRQLPSAAIVKKRFLRLLKLLCFFVAGFSWAGLFAHNYLEDQLPKEWENRELTVIGLVDSLPVRLAQGAQFNFQIEEFVAPDSLVTANNLDHFPRKISVGWFQASTHFQESSAIKPGERWRLTLRLKRAHGNANPYGFDYEAWLLEQGIRTTASVRNEGASGSGLDNRRLSPFVWRLGHMIERCRYLLREKIQSALVDAPYAGVLVALVVGDQREISQADWKVFNRTGVGHLISISGLHITMIAGLFAGLMQFCWRRSFFTGARLPLLIPAPKVAVLAGVFAALVYVALAGFGVPAQRTLIMLIVVAVAVWTNRASSVSHVLCAALGLVVLFDPWAVLWPGFWLSFSAVAMLLFANAGRLQVRTHTGLWQGIWHQLHVAWRAQYAVTVGLLSLTLLMFAQVSLVSPLANAVAIPLISFIVTPLALLGSVLPAPLSDGCLNLAHVCVSLLAKFLTFLSETPIAVWSAPIPSVWMFALALVGTLWLLMPRGWPLPYLGLFCWLPIFLNPATSTKYGEMRVTAFDVGQGTAVLIETAHHRLLYDTGPGFSLETNSATRVLLPYFQARGISALDSVMVSHSDSDHSGGAVSLLAQMPVKTVMTSLKLDHPIVLASRAHQRCVAGQVWDWDGVHFEILHPVPVIYTSSKWKPNAFSCTLKISTKYHSLLLAGDIEAIQEDELVNSIAHKLAATVLLAPHHGSATSSTLPFLQIVKPEIALFQVGYLNRFHHPRSEVMQRYLDIGVMPLRTDTGGAITLQFADVLSFTEYRREHARYWHQE